MHSGQLRAARALLRMDQATFARAAGVSVETIKRMERANREITASDDSTQRVLSALDLLNIELIEEGYDDADAYGVKLVVRDEHYRMRQALLAGVNEIYDIIDYLEANEPGIFKRSVNEITDTLIAAIASHREEIAAGIARSLNAQGYMKGLAEGRLAMPPDDPNYEK